MLHPQMREAMGEARPFDKEQKDKNRIFLHPFMRHSAKPQSKGAGAVNLVVPVYTIAIILFFMYSLFKMMLKKNNETCHSTSVKPCKANAIHKFAEVEEHLEKRKVNAHERKTHRVLEQYGKEKVLTALKTIILEMEDFKGNFSEMDVRPTSVPDALGSTFDSSA
ncbi:uncharacterized protein LOC118204335 isoform X2 [Stegodyphus dumicola]|uniref:uncharacterized protein LOC118204335 isoform X2 n=1 Tax=Stegodyphus dumicola TaxID=202533 RepID=UPI0015AAB7C0|nr:uncharacterized protein LOC118204335 isoform X2 [Stegodyphus dumicola]